MILFLIITAFVTGGCLTPLLLEYFKAREQQEKLEKKLKLQAGLLSKPEKLVQLPCCGLYTTGSTMQHLRKPVATLEEYKILDSDRLPALVRQLILKRDNLELDQVSLENTTTYFVAIFRDMGERGMVVTLYPAILKNWSCKGSAVDGAFTYQASANETVSLAPGFLIVPQPITTHDHVTIVDNKVAISTFANENHLPLQEATMTPCTKQHLVEHECSVCKLEHLHDHDCSVKASQENAQTLLELSNLREQLRLAEQERVDADIRFQNILDRLPQSSKAMDPGLTLQNRIIITIDALLERNRVLEHLNSGASAMVSKAREIMYSTLDSLIKISPAPVFWASAYSVVSDLRSVAAAQLENREGKSNVLRIRFFSKQMNSECIPTVWLDERQAKAQLSTLALHHYVSIAGSVVSPHGLTGAAFKIQPDTQLTKQPDNPNLVAVMVTDYVYVIKRNALLGTLARLFECQPL